MKNNPDGTLNKQEFVKLYTAFKDEPHETLDEIAENIFRAFDPDNNGAINFNEFMVNYTFVVVFVFANKQFIFIF
jgi:Ca2+-binding EF-hand superfamily protein